MKKFIRATVPLYALTLCLLPSCMDDKYDLSDVDTNVEVKVTDLVVPVNIDPVTMSSIFEIKDGDCVQVVDGYYAVLESGDFNTDEINIERIKVNAPYIESQNQTIHVSTNSAPRAKAPASEYKFSLSTPESSFSYYTSGVSDYIVSIEEVGAHLTFDITMTFNELNGVIKGASIENLQLKIPTGLVLVNPEGTYDAVTGIYSIPTLKMNGNKANIHIEASAIDVKKSSIKFDYNAHSFEYKGYVAVVAGEMCIKSSDMNSSATMPSTITLRSDYKLSDIEVTSFTGEMKYNIDDSSFSDIDLSNLPDFLSQEGTDIRIVNPQLYLNITNPLYKYSVYAETGLKITSTGQQGEKRNYTLDNGTFRLQGNPNTPEINYCLSPSVPDKWYGSYTDATYEPFTSLSDILSGNGLPRTLSVEMVNPQVPVQRVKGLKLGENLGKVKGTYTFFAPLNLKVGSSIVYSKREDGWSSEDLDAVTIKTLEVNVDVSTNVPLGVHFTGYPIDKKGNRINNVNIEGAEIVAMAKDQHVKIYITGEVKCLDGIEFVATAVSQDPDVILNPDMTINLKNVKAKVSGVYNKKL